MPRGAKAAYGRGMPDETEDSDLLRPVHASRLAGVTTDTLAAWVASGKLAAVFTPGGQRRYRRADILAIYGGGRPE